MHIVSTACYAHFAYIRSSRDYVLKKASGKIGGVVVSCDENTIVLEVTRKKKRKKVTKEVAFLVTDKTKVVKSKVKKLTDITEGSKVIVGFFKEEGDVNFTAVWVKVVKLAKAAK